MTARQWQLIACFALLAALVVLGVSLVRQTASERAGVSAAARLARMTHRADSLELLAAAAGVDAKVYQAQRDSIRQQLPDTVFVPRQYTQVVIDTSAIDPESLASIVTIVAERDTALADLVAARTDIRALRATIVTLDSLATQHAAVDSVRWAHVVAIADTLQSEIHEVRGLVRPRWYRRWGGGLARTGKVVGVAVLAFALGRAS